MARICHKVAKFVYFSASRGYNRQQMILPVIIRYEGDESVAPGIELRDYIKDNLLIGDGAMATWLYNLGVTVGVCYEELCISRPDLIKEVHRQYYEAGARLIETNTFGAHREALSRFGLEDSVYRINFKAAVIAREAVGSDAFVMGCMTSISGARPREVNMQGYRSLFVEQAEALLAGGVDGLILETFLDLEELVLAVEAVRSLTGRTIIAQLACIEPGRTRDGYTVSQAFSALQKAGADIAGLNCRLGPAEILRSLREAVVPEGLFISAFPNAGRPEISDDEFVYTSSPQYFASRALDLREQGVRIIGGCCGTTPQHIKAVAGALAGLGPLPRVNPPQFEVEPMKAVSISGPAEKTPTLVDTVKQRPVVLVEFDPPKDLEVENYIKGAAVLQEAGVDAITMADNSLAQTRMSNLALAAIVKQRLRVTPLPHITCRDRNLIGQQSHLMGLHALGINHVLVVTGDPARFGDLPGASSVFDVSSFDLIRMIKQLNQGISFSGTPLKQKAGFVVGAAFNPHAARIENAVARLQKKIESGADFAMTQPVYDLKTIEVVHRVTRDLPIPVFLGIMPLTSLRNAVFLHNEVPGIRISDEVMKRMSACSSPEEARQEGLAIARELLDAALELFNGIYLVTPFSNYQMTAELTRYVRCKEKTAGN